MKLKCGVILCIVVVLTGSVYKARAQENNHSPYPKITAYLVKGNDYIDSATYVDLVISSSWLNFRIVINSKNVIQQLVSENIMQR
jgi:hypothetical protein